MTSQTCYAGTITQNTGSKNVKFNNLNNLKNANNSYAKTDLIGNKSDSKKTPSAITLSNFGFNIPVGAMVTKIVIEYAQQRLDKTQGKYPSLPAPTITLKSSGIDSTFTIHTGVVPATTLKEKSSVYDGSYEMRVSDGIINPATGTTGTKVVSVIKNAYQLPSRTVINNSNFGVVFKFGANTSSNNGYLQFKYIRIRVDYTLPNFGLKINQLTEDEITVWDTVPFEVVLSNINLTDYDPAVTITMPEGASVVSASGDGIYSNVGSTITWDPLVSKNQGTYTLRLNVVFNATGTKSINVTENYNNTSYTLSGIVVNAIIVDTHDVVVSDTHQLIYTKVGDDFTVPISLSAEVIDTWVTSGITNVYIFTDTALKQKNGSSYSSISANGYMQIPISSLEEGATYNLTCKSETTGDILLYLSTSSSTRGDTVLYQIRVMPSNYTFPEIAIVKLQEEELNRLGNGFNYNVTSKVKVSASSASYYTDHYRNYRMGIVNNTDSIVAREIFEACTTWSEGISTINEWENRSLEFAYDSDYPVYVLFTGNFHEDSNYSMVTMQFLAPEVVEDNEENTNDQVVFPSPILNLLDDTNTADESIYINTESNTIKFYDLPVIEDFGTNEDYAVRGISLNLRAEVDETIIANVALVSNHGVKKYKSVILTPSINEYIIGGEFDNWGFKIGEMEDLNNWEFHLSLANTLQQHSNEYWADINFIEVSSTIWYDKIDSGQANKFYVEGENLEWYGAFIRDYALPAGLKTNTKYLNIDGTDTNNAYRMNIVEKEFTIEFDIDSCSLEESTALLNEITKLFTNERDELDQPIPKKLEASFLPGQHFMYILEDGVENTVEISGYKCKVKLTIPDGTSFSNEPTITNAAGIVKGIAKVSPYIIVIPTDNTLSLTEEYSEQNFTATNSNWIGKYVEIDCENRILWQRENEDAIPTRISGSVDMDADWFKLDTSFRFQPVGCVIQSVEFTERG